MTADARAGRSQRGFTLLELLVVMGILSGFLIMLVRFVDTGVRLFEEGESGQALADRAETARLAVERELRALHADCRRLERGVPPDRLIVQQLPLGLPPRPEPTSPRGFLLRGGVSLSPLAEERMMAEATLIEAALELGIDTEPSAIAARAGELRASRALRGRGRIVLAQWPTTEDGALIELRIVRLFEDQLLRNGDGFVDPFEVVLPGGNDLPSVLLHGVSDLLVDDLLFAGIALWSQDTTGWDVPGAAGPEASWDSARGGWLLDPVDGPVFSLDKGPHSLADPTDDVHPRALRVTLVVAADGLGPREGLLAYPLEPRERVLELVNGERFPGPEDGGFAKVGGEWVRYGERRGDQLRGLQRGERGTHALAHPGGTAVRFGRTVEFTVPLPHARSDWNRRDG